jgi:hypothetical protein
VDKPEVSRRLSVQSDKILASMRSIGSSLGGKKRKSSLFLSGLKDSPSDLDSEMGSEKGSAGGFESELGSPRDIDSNPSF